MKKFLYKIKNSDGNILTGFMEAESKQDVLRVMVGEGYFVVRVDIVDERKHKISYNIPLDSLVRFSQKFYAMLKAGVPILPSLRIIWEQTEDIRLQLILSDILISISQGSFFSAALKKHPVVFSSTYTNLIEVGEKGGDLVDALKRIIEHLQRQKELAQKVQQALVYPTIVLGATILVIVVMLAFVVPAFKAMLMEIKAELPLITQILIQISNGFLYFWWVGFLMFGAAFFAFKRYYVTARGRFEIDALMLKIPLVGPIIFSASLSRFIHSLKALSGSGINISEALVGAERSFDNVYLEKKVSIVNELISKGKRISDSLSETKVFPPFVIQMITIGENSGMLGEMLQVLGDFLDEELDHQIQRLMTALGPFLILVVGVIVLFVLISIYLPIFTLWSNLGR